MQRFTVRGTAELVGTKGNIYALRLPFRTSFSKGGSTYKYYLVEIYSLRPDPRNVLQLNRTYNSEVIYENRKTPRLVEATIHGRSGSRTFRLCKKVYKSIVSVQ